MSTSTFETSTLRDTPTDYGLPTRLFHWTIGLSIIGLLIAGLLLANMPQGSSAKMPLMFVHKSLGITVLALALGRILWRSFQSGPNLPADEPKPLQLAANLTHGLLYAAMFLMPVTGYLMSTAGGHPVSFWGLFTLPALIAPNPAMGNVYFGLHELMGYTLIGIIALHLAGVAYHVLFRHDDILPRMLHSARFFMTGPIKRTRA